MLDDANTISLIHPYGADESTDIVDESGKIWGAAGGAKIDSAQSYFPGVSLYFPSNGDVISTPDSAVWQLDGGSNSNKWTFDCRLRFNGDPGTGIRGIFNQFLSEDEKFGLYLNNNVLRFVVRTGATNTVLLDFAWNPADATWYHLAFVKDGTNGYMAFIDGTKIGTTQVDTSPIPNYAATMYLGGYSISGTFNSLIGWMQESRFSNIARWTANFTPPTGRYGIGGGSPIFFD